ncbi:right-handed parallel beta-helix repeat-containing protein, partial [Methanobrevibacter sp.]|uniref:right-handed parallel beta-helix repeat-containing protein n=1 Tax=Methanobrevibacter sp. TaxID=66852 RepID=UPI0038653BB4
MDYKKSIIVLLLAIFLFSITGVCASEIDDSIASEDTNQIKLSDSDKVIEDNGQTNEKNSILAQTNNVETLSAENDTEILHAKEGTYSDLSHDIHHNGGVLTKSYYRYHEDDGLTIEINDDDFTVNGNGAVIDMGSTYMQTFYVFSSNVTFKNLTIINARYDGGAAIYFDHSGSVENCNFTNNTATGPASFGGAVYFHDTGTVTNCNFINNTAGDGGAVLIYSGSVENCNFTDNTASRDGGAVWIYSGSVENCNFTGNDATTGSAIYFLQYSATKSVSNSIFLNNRANAKDLEVIKNDNNITITFTGNDNLLNAIYSNGDVNFTNVTYWGAKGINNTGSSPIALSGSNREAGQNITVGVVVNNKLVLSDIKVTDEKGMIVLDIRAGENYYISVRHDTDSYYTEAERTISNNTKFNVNVTSQKTNNKTVNITAKSNIPNEVIDGKLLFILSDGNKINATYGGNGTWWAMYPFADYKVYSVNASYTGLDNVTVNNGTITINKADSTITLEDITLDYGESKNVTVKTEGATKITANINGTDVTVINNYTIAISGLAAGNYTLNVTTVPDGDHNSVSKEVKVIVNKVTAVIAVDSATVDIKVLDEVLSGATLTPSDAGNLTYKSSNETVVIVKDGKIKALAKGNATITVSFAGNENYTAAKNKTISVTVNLKDASFSLNNSTLDLFVDDNFTVVATTSPAGLKVTFVQDDSGVYIVDGNGNVTALKEGTGNILVKVGGDGVYAENTTEITVIVSKIPTEITVDTTPLDLFVGDETVIVANLTPAGACNVTFTSSDYDVVDFDFEGNVIAQGKGQAIITVSFA